MKKILYLIVLLGFLLQTTIVFAQQIPSAGLQPGCTLVWVAPLIEDLPDNPGTQISQWQHAGDHKGFIFNTRKDDQHVWDDLLAQKIEDPSLLTVPCPTIGVEDLGEYSVGIKTEDFALNASPAAWITFRLVAQDNTALDPIAEICFEGIHNGQPIKTCQRSVVP